MQRVRRTFRHNSYQRKEVNSHSYVTTTNKITPIAMFFTVAACAIPYNIINTNIQLILSDTCLNTLLCPTRACGPAGGTISRCVSDMRTRAVRSLTPLLDTRSEQRVFPCPLTLLRYLLTAIYTYICYD